MPSQIVIKIAERKSIIGIIPDWADYCLWEKMFEWMLDDALQLEIKDDEVVEIKICKELKNKELKSICKGFVGIEGNLFKLGINYFYKIVFKEMLLEIDL